MHSQIAPTFNAMLKAISEFSAADFNQIPFEESWTAAQVAEHVKLSIEGIPELFTGATQASDRDPGEKVQMVADVFLDFETKYESPEFIVPQQKEYSIESFTSFFSAYSERLAHLVEELDMSRSASGLKYLASDR